jgi:hypothetical protein
MKRDIELIRLILLREEQGAPPPALAAYATGLISYNSALAIEAGLLRGEVMHEGGSNISMGIVRGLTWAGHDFLDATRDPLIWNKTRSRALALGTSWSLLLEFIDDQTRRRLSMRRR